MSLHIFSPTTTTTKKNNFSLKTKIYILKNNFQFFTPRYMHFAKNISQYLRAARDCQGTRRFSPTPARVSQRESMLCCCIARMAVFIASYTLCELSRARLSSSLSELIEKFHTVKLLNVAALGELLTFRIWPKVLQQQQQNKMLYMALWRTAAQRELDFLYHTTPRATILYRWRFSLLSAYLFSSAFFLTIPLPLSPL